MMMTSPSVEKAIGINIVGEENVRDAMSIKVCDVGENDVVPSTTGTTTTASVCVSSASTMGQFVDRLAAAGGDSIVRNNAKGGFVISATSEVLDTQAPFHSTSNPMIDEKVNRESVPQATDQAELGSNKNATESGEPVSVDNEKQNCERKQEKTDDVPITEDVIDGFAFASFNIYQDLEEWVRREEQKLRQLLQQSDAADGNDAATKSCAAPEAKPKRRRKRVENKLATSAWNSSANEAGCFSGAGGTAINAVYTAMVDGFGSPNRAQRDNDIKMATDLTLNEHSPQPVATVDIDRSSPVRRPKSSSAAIGPFIGAAGQSAAGSTCARVKRPANNSNRNGQTDQFSSPAKVPKRETSDNAPGDPRKEVPTGSTYSPSPSKSSNIVETNEVTSAERALRSPAGTIKNKMIQSHEEQLAAVINSTRHNAMSFVSGNLAEQMLIDRTVQGAIPNSIPATGAAACSTAATIQSGSGKATPAAERSLPAQVQHLRQSVCADPTSPHVPVKSEAMNAIGRSVGALFPPVGASLLTPMAGGSVTTGAPAYFHMDMRQHQQTPPHPYPPFLSPLLGATRLPGMVGLPSAYPGMTAFPSGPQLLGVPPISSQLATGAGPTLAKKKGKWCAMHVQIAWHIYNKMALRRERKTDANHVGTASGAASMPFNSESTASTSNSSLEGSSSGRCTGSRSAGISSSSARASMNTGATGISEKSRSTHATDAEKEHRRRDREKQHKLNSMQRVGDMENMRLNSAQNGVQFLANVSQESSRAAIDQRYNNGNSVGYRASSTIAPSPLSATLPLKMEHSASTPLFQDGLLLREQANPFPYSSASLTAPGSTSSLSTYADGLFSSAGQRITFPVPSSSINFPGAPAHNNVIPNLALSANLAAAADRMRPMTPSSAAGQAASGTSLDMAYRTLMCLDNAATLGRGVDYDLSLLRPPLLLDPMMVGRQRELLRLQQQQQQQLLASAARQDMHNSAASSNPLSSMIDVERTGSRSTMASGAPRSVSQSPNIASLQLAPPQQMPMFFNPQMLNGLDTATAAAAAAAAASLYSTGLFQRERLEFEQLRLLGVAGGQCLPGAPAAPPTNVDPYRLGYLGAAGNPYADPMMSARASLGNAGIPGMPSNLGLNFGLGLVSVAQPHLPSSSANAIGSLVNNNLMSPFSNSLEQLARQKRDVLLASAAAAAGNANAYQNR